MNPQGITSIVVTSCGASLVTYASCTISLQWGSLFIGLLVGLLLYSIMDQEIKMAKIQKREIRRKTRRRRIAR